MENMSVSAASPAMSDVGQDALDSAGVEKSDFDAKAEEIETKDPAIQKKIQDAYKDGKLSEQEQDDIGEMVADKALKALTGEGLDQLTPNERMNLADYCGNCLNQQAGEAIDASSNVS